MKRGEAVEREEDAELARRAARQLEYVRKATRPLSIAGGGMVAFILIAGILSGSTGLAICGAVGLGGSALFGVLSQRQRHKFRQSLAATERLLES